MKQKSLDYSELVRTLYYNYDNLDDKFNSSICRNVTLQITSSCNLRCTYCYEHHKCEEDMTYETATSIIDSVFDMYDRDDNIFINHHTRAIILEFIGGEPLIKAGLIERVCDYWFKQGILRGIPFIPYTRISFATNGVAWFTKESQHFIKKYSKFLSITVSIDGVKELHDLHRIDKGGNGSFDKAIAAFRDGKNYGWYFSKMTFVPDSFPYIFDSIKMMIDEGCNEIYCNCAYEPLYSLEDAHKLFEQLRKLSDYLIDNKLDVFVSILDSYIGGKRTYKGNYCGGTGNMIAYDTDGNAYPCLRYCPISIGKEKASKMMLGDYKNGLYHTEEQKKIKEFLDSITYESQSEQKCIDCPISAGCAWCSAMNYEVFGTPNKRSTNICLAHKARVLAIYYYINKRYIEIGDCSPKKINIPYEEAVELIGEENALDVFTYEYAADLKYINENNLELIDGDWYYKK